MAIILKNDYLNIKIDSHKIIGIMGKGYYDFINSFKGDKIEYVLDEKGFLTDNVLDEIKSCYFNDDFDVIFDYLKEFNFEKEFLDKKISELSESEKRILKYILAFISNKSIIVIDNVYQDLDYFYKKKVKYWLKRMIKDNKKTIIIGSNNSNDIYDICQKILLIDDDEYDYGDTDKIMVNNELMKKYGIKKPQIIKFVDLCQKKRVKINYTNDIRDLIKEVYKSVGEKKY